MIPEQVEQIYWYGGALIVAIIVLGLVVWGVGRWTRRQDAGGSPVFTLQDLREMRERGEISDAEFDQMRASILAGHRLGAVPSRDRPGSRPEE